MNKIKAIAFDLDQTLLDFVHMKQATARAAARAMARRLGNDEETLYKQIFSVYDTYGMEYQKTFARVLLKYKLDFNTFERIQQGAILAYNKAKYAKMRPYPGVVKILKTLKKKYKLAVVTDAPRNKAWQRLVIGGLEKIFDIVVTLDDTDLLKPNPAPFERLLMELRLRPEQVLMVGDNAAKDIAGAKAVGMRTALADYGIKFYSREYARAPKSSVRADYKLKKFADLLKVLKRLG